MARVLWSLKVPPFSTLMDAIVLESVTTKSCNEMVNSSISSNPVFARRLRRQNNAKYRLPHPWIYSVSCGLKGLGRWFRGVVWL